MTWFVLACLVVPALFLCMSELDRAGASLNAISLSLIIKKAIASLGTNRTLLPAAGTWNGPWLQTKERVRRLYLDRGSGPSAFVYPATAVLGAQLHSLPPSPPPERRSRSLRRRGHPPRIRGSRPSAVTSSTHGGAWKRVLARRASRLSRTLLFSFRTKNHQIALRTIGPNTTRPLDLRSFTKRACRSERPVKRSTWRYSDSVDQFVAGQSECIRSPPPSRNVGTRAPSNSPMSLTVSEYDRRRGRAE